MNDSFANRDYPSIIQLRILFIENNTFFKGQIYFMISMNYHTEKIVAMFEIPCFQKCSRWCGFFNPGFSVFETAINSISLGNCCNGLYSPNPYRMSHPARKNEGKFSDSSVQQKESNFVNDSLWDDKKIKQADWHHITN